MGPCRLTRLEIRAWQEDEAISLEPWERRALMALDAAWLTSVIEAQNAAQKPK